MFRSSFLFELVQFRLSIFPAKVRFNYLVDFKFVRFKFLSIFVAFQLNGSNLFRSSFLFKFVQFSFVQFNYFVDFKFVYFQFTFHFCRVSVQLVKFPSISVVKTFSFFCRSSSSYRCPLCVVLCEKYQVCVPLPEVRQNNFVSFALRIRFPGTVYLSSVSVV